MKRFFVLAFMVLTLLGLSSCSKDENTRTHYFYENIDKTSFWYQCTITKGDETYRYAQAVDSDSVTTIEDHDKDEDDGYAIYEPDKNMVHSLNFNTKKYDTTYGTNGTKFLFGSNEAYQFRAPDESLEEVEFEGKTYYCEIFETVDENGDEVGQNKYYFEGMTLKAIEWIEDGKVVTTMRIVEYSNKIPDSVYTSIPEGFKAGNFIHEEVIPPRPVINK